MDSLLNSPVELKHGVHQPRYKKKKERKKNHGEFFQYKVPGSLECVHTASENMIDEDSIRVGQQNKRQSRENVWID